MVSVQDILGDIKQNVSLQLVKIQFVATESEN